MQQTGSLFPTPFGEGSSAGRYYTAPARIPGRSKREPCDGPHAAPALLGEGQPGMWPRVRKQRTPDGAMDIWELSERCAATAPPPFEGALDEGANPAKGDEDAADTLAELGDGFKRISIPDPADAAALAPKPDTEPPSPCAASVASNSSRLSDIRLSQLEALVAEEAAAEAAAQAHFEAEEALQQLHASGQVADEMFYGLIGQASRPAMHFAEPAAHAMHMHIPPAVPQRSLAAAVTVPNLLPPARSPHGRPSATAVEMELGGRRGKEVERKEWLASEDQIIRDGVQRLGCRWRRIAERLPGRSDDAVRNRWNRLKEMERKGPDACDAAPDELSESSGGAARPAAASTSCDGQREEEGAGKTERVSWTTEEDAIVVNSVKAHGHKWSQISQSLPGRTDHAIRNRWQRLLKLENQARNGHAAKTKRFPSADHPLQRGHFHPRFPQLPSQLPPQLPPPQLQLPTSGRPVPGPLFTGAEDARDGSYELP